jgi:hypothetical protein
MKMKVVYYDAAAPFMLPNAPRVFEMPAGADGSFTWNLPYVAEADSIILYANFDSVTTVTPGGGKATYTETRTYKIARTGGEAGRIGVPIQAILKAANEDVSKKPAWLGRAAGKAYGEAIEIATNSFALGN